MATGFELEQEHWDLIVQFIGEQAMRTVILVAGPMLVSGMIVGLVISIFQAATFKAFA